MSPSNDFMDHGKTDTLLGALCSVILNEMIIFANGGIPVNQNSGSVLIQGAVGDAGKYMTSLNLQNLDINPRIFLRYHWYWATFCEIYAVS